MGIRPEVFRLFLGFLTLSSLLPAPCRAPEEQAVLADQPRMAARPAPPLVPDFGKIPLQFIPNRGQKDGRVAYYVAGRDKTVYFTAEGLTYVLGGQKGQAGLKENDPFGTPDQRRPGRWVVRLDFVEPGAEVKPVGLEASGTVVSYFKGQPGEWKTALAGSSKIIYRDLWPGIDLIYSGSYDAMKYEFLVHPGADPARIRLAYRGAETVGLTTDGRLEARTPAGSISDDRPLAYQDVGGRQKAVVVAYDVAEGTYGFKLGDYDKSRTLVLDPSVLVYCGYVGGDAAEASQGIAVDAAGNAYIAGTTPSTEASFPVTVGPDLTFNGGETPAYDVFVARVNAAGTALDYCGFIGGSGTDSCLGIAVDAAGNACVTGFTNSSEVDFPVVAGPDLTYNGGENDAWVAKIDPSGTALLYCGYIGGSGGEIGRGIAVDTSGQAYIAGQTTSAQDSFPLAVGPDLTFNSSAGGYDAFVTKVSASGTSLLYSGYIGGSNFDLGYGIAVDGSGSAYVTGYTVSRESTFPVNVGPSLVAKGGVDAFVAKVSATGDTLDYCGFVGGQVDDFSYAIAVDGSGCACITGETLNDEGTFPVVVGPLLTGRGGFVAKIKSDGTGLVYCGFLGPLVGALAGRGIAADASGSAYVTGETSLDQAELPVTVGPDLTHNGIEDAFVAKVKPDGTGFDYFGYIGGISRDKGSAIAVDGFGNAYVTGTTGSPADAPWYFPATVGPDLTLNGGANVADAFVAKVPPVPVALPLPVLTAVVPDNCIVGSTDVTFIVEGANFIEGAVVKWHGEDRTTTFVNSTRLEATIDTVHLAVAGVVEVLVVNGDGEVGNPLTFSINNPLPSLASISPASVTGGGPDFRMTLTGTDFFGQFPVVRWNGVDMAMCGTAGRTEMWAEVPASLIATGGEVEITIYNPPPGGGTSNAIILPVSTFSLNPSPATRTVNAGQSATFTIELTPQFGSFDAAVSFVKGALPRNCTASFSAASVTPGAGAVSTTLTVNTQARSSSAAGMAGPLDFFPPALGLLLAGLLALSLFLSRRLSGKPLRRWAMAAVLIGAFIALGACSSGGGGGDPSQGTPAGTYQISVEGRSGNVAVSTTVSLTVR
jgi:hypothetical protein